MIRVRHLKAAGIAASATARPHFTGQQSDQTQFGPLAGPEGTHQLLLGVIEGRRNRVYSGNRQIAPRKMAVRSKLLRSGIWVNGILGDCRFQIADFRLKIITARAIGGGLAFQSEICNLNLQFLLLVAQRFDRIQL
jgi:hypothetical protein